MITIITFNPSIDRLYRVSRINIGEVQRVMKYKFYSRRKRIKRDKSV